MFSILDIECFMLSWYLLLLLLNTLGLCLICLGLYIYIYICIILSRVSYIYSGYVCIDLYIYIYISYFIIDVCWWFPIDWYWFPIGLPIDFRYFCWYSLLLDMGPGSGRKAQVAGADRSRSTDPRGLVLGPRHRSNYGWT